MGFKRSCYHLVKISDDCSYNYHKTVEFTDNKILVWLISDCPMEELPFGIIWYLLWSSVIVNFNFGEYNF